MMTKFKVNEKVKVKKNIKVGKLYGDVSFVEGMKCRLGKKVTISKVMPDFDEYYIKEDNEEWFWVREMFEL